MTASIAVARTLLVPQSTVTQEALAVYLQNKRTLDGVLANATEHQALTQSTEASLKPLSAA